LDIAGLTQDITADFERTLGERLVSLSLHGLNTPLFWPAHCVLVIEPSADLRGAHGLLAKWRRRGLEPPLILGRADIAGAVEWFPLELLNLRLDAQQLSGDDILTPVGLEPRDLRAQCGRELRGKLVVLRRAYGVSTLPEELTALVAASLPLYLAIFRGLLYLKGREPLLAPEAVVEAASSVASINVTLFESLTSAALGRRMKDGKRWTQEALHRLFSDYLAEAERLARIWDKLA
jgi:hypothetical protein